MNKKEKIILLKINQITLTLEKGSPTAKNLVIPLKHLALTDAGKKLFWSLPTNIDFNITDTLYEGHAEYIAGDKNKRSRININRITAQKNPFFTAVCIMHELRHHTQEAFEKEITLKSANEFFFQRLLQEAEARVQDLNLLACAPPDKLDKVTFKTIPLEAYQDYLKSSPNLDSNQTNTYFFKELLQGKQNWARPWFNAYVKNIQSNLILFTPNPKADEKNFEKLLSQYATRMNVSANELMQIYHQLIQPQLPQQIILTQKNSRVSFLD